MARKTNCQTSTLGEEYEVDLCLTYRGAAAKEQLSSAQRVSDFVHKLYPLSNWDREKFIVIACNARLNPVAAFIANEGGTASANVDPGPLFRRLTMIPNATAIFFIHNHPSLDATPSAQDLRLNQVLTDGCKLLGLRALDHLVVTIDPGVWSSTQEGMSIG